MSDSALGIHHQRPSSTTSSSSVAVASVVPGQRQVTDHSVESLLQSSSSASPVAESCVGLPRHRADISHSMLARCLSPATAALLPSVDEALLPAQLCHMETSSFQGADVTDSDVVDGAVSVRLEHKDLWDKFNALGTEMVITKSGRYHISYLYFHCLERLELDQVFVISACMSTVGRRFYRVVHVVQSAVLLS